MKTLMSFMYNYDFKSYFSLVSVLSNFVNTAPGGFVIVIKVKIYKWCMFCSYE